MFAHVSIYFLESQIMFSVMFKKINDFGGGVCRGHGTRLPVSTKEFLSKCSAVQEGKAEPCPHTLQCGRGVADLNWVHSSKLEGILWRSPQSHQHAFWGGGRAGGFWGWLSSLGSRSLRLSNDSTAATPQGWMRFVPNSSRLWIF